MFQRVGAIAYKKDLTNTLRLCEVLGNPHRKFKSIHIAGTNGKGSTSHMLASVLQSAGYRTGLYTSPHLKEFTERIRINGEEVSNEFVIDFVNRIQPYIDEIKPSFFEITVAMAFDYFASQNIDVAVIETGLGGRLDSTNVITPVLSVITNIGFDHKDLLGDTLEQISGEKAGIIKQGVPVVVSEHQDAVAHVFIKVATERKSPLTFASDALTVEKKADGYTVFERGRLLLKEVRLPLIGNYQSKNLAGVVQAWQLLSELGFQIPQEKLVEGLEKTIEQTSLKGRWQKLNEHPTTVCDTGHNVDGVKEIVQQLQQQSYQKLHIVWGMVKDKEPTEILKLLPKSALYYFCQAKIPRALAVDQLVMIANEMELQGKAFPDVNAAIRAARLAASPEDFIFIGGSTFVVAEIENL